MEDQTIKKGFLGVKFETAEGGNYNMKESENESNESEGEIV